MKNLMIIMLILISSNLFAEKTYTVQKGDTLYSISKKNNVPVDDLIRLNNIKNVSSLSIGSILILEPSANDDSKFHLVEKGDTLFSISRKYGISLSDIMSYNKMMEGDLISIGQQIYLGSKEPVIVTIKNDILQKNFDDKVIWPVDGRIGDYRGRIKGYEIISESGQDIRVVSNGRVVWYDSYKGIGKVVLIAGDNGYDYLYGTNDVLNVRLGGVVTTGDKIGRLEGDNTKVIFSVFKNGKPVENMNSISR